MNTFTKHHLAITKNRYFAEKIARAPVEHEDGLNILEIRPDYDTYALLLDHVGAPWDWTRRPRYARGNRRALAALLKAPHTRLFLLRRDKKVLGYCLTANPAPEPRVLEKIGHAPQPARFRPDVIEIENFGLFPQHTGKKYGRYFLPALLEKLFADHEAVYLSTRSTNHARVVPFYESLGLHTIHRETLPDDLLPYSASTRELSA